MIKRLSIFFTVVLFVLLLFGPSGVYSATFIDSFDNSVFTNANWAPGTAVPQTWTFPILSGSDLGYHASTTSFPMPAAMQANSGQAYYNADLSIETLVRIDSHVNADSMENMGGIVFSSSEDTGYGAGIGINYDQGSPPSIFLFLNIIDDNIIDFSFVSINFDTFYKLVVDVGSDQSMTVSLYGLDDILNPIQSISSSKVLSNNAGAVGIWGRPEVTFDDFLLTGNPVPIPATIGDIDGNNDVTLTDAILALQVVIGQDPLGVRSNYATSGADVNNDGKIGLQEVIYTMQKVSGLHIVP